MPLTTRLASGHGFPIRESKERNFFRAERAVQHAASVRMYVCHAIKDQLPGLLGESAKSIYY